MRVDAYTVCLAVHLIAVAVWIGHMLFWSLVVGPVAKRAEPPEEGERLRAAATRHGGLGWPALAVLFATGLVLLHLRGVFDEGGFEALAASGGGRLFLVKLALVGGMVAYQYLVGHRPAPKLIYLDILAALLIVALSVAFAHPGGGGGFSPSGVG